MRNRFNPLTLHFLAICLACGQSVYYYPRLPALIASHFGVDGVANGWMGKQGFFVSYAVMMLLTAGFLGGIGLIFTKIPTELMNLPNKAYWLAPERRDATLNSLQDQMSWLGVATMVLFIATMQLTFQANMVNPPVLDNRTTLLVFAYLGYTLVWSVMLIRRFAVPR